MKTEAKVEFKVNISVFIEDESNDEVNLVGDANIGFEFLNKKSFHREVFDILSSKYTNVKIEDTGTQDGDIIDYSFTATEVSSGKSIKGTATLSIEDEVMDLINKATKASTEEVTKKISEFFSDKETSEVYDLASDINSDGDTDIDLNHAERYELVEFIADHVNGLIKNKLCKSVEEFLTEYEEGAKTIYDRSEALFPEGQTTNNDGKGTAKTHNKNGGFFAQVHLGYDITLDEAANLFAEAEALVSKKLNVNVEVAAAILDLHMGTRLSTELQNHTTQWDINSLVKALPKAFEKMEGVFKQVLHSEITDIEAYIANQTEASTDYEGSSTAVTKNELYGFYGTVKSAFDLNNKDAAKLFAEAEKILSTKLSVSKEIAGAVLDFKDGKWLAEEATHFANSDSSFEEMVAAVDKAADKMLKGLKKLVKEDMDALEEYLSTTASKKPRYNINVDDDEAEASKYGDVKGQEPAEKDIQRIKDLETKAKGDESKMLKLAQNMANTLGGSPDSMDKAIRRAKACEIVYKGDLGKKLAKVFMDTAVNQKAAASNEVKVWFKKDKDSKWELFDGTITDDLIVEKHIKGKRLKESNKWFDVWVTNNVNDVLKANEEVTASVSEATKSEMYKGWKITAQKKRGTDKYFYKITGINFSRTQGSGFTDTPEEAVKLAKKEVDTSMSKSEVSLADNSISKETLDKIKKDTKIESMVKDLAAKEKELKKVRPIIDELYNKVLKEYNILEKDGSKITDHKYVYRADKKQEADVSKFFKECNDEALKLYPETKKEYCPALVIESAVVSLQNQIIESLENYYPFLKGKYISSDVRKDLLEIHKKLFA